MNNFQILILLISICSAEILNDGVPFKLNGINSVSLDYSINPKHRNNKIRSYITLDATSQTSIKISMSINGKEIIPLQEYIEPIAIEEIDEYKNAVHKITVSSSAPMSGVITAAGAIYLSDCSPVTFDSSNFNYMVHFIYEAKNTHFSHENDCTLISSLLLNFTKGVSFYFEQEPNSQSTSEFNKYSLYQYIPVFEDGTVFIHALGIEGGVQEATVNSFLTLQYLNDCNGKKQKIHLESSGSYAFYRVLQVTASVSGLPLSIIESSQFDGTMEVYYGICNAEKIGDIKSGDDTILLANNWSNNNFAIIVKYNVPKPIDIEVIHYEVIALSSTNEFFMHSDVAYGSFSLCGLTQTTKITTSLDQTITISTGIDTVPIEDATSSSKEIVKQNLEGGSYIVLFKGKYGIVETTFEVSNDIFELPPEGTSRIGCSNAVYSVIVEEGAMDYFVMLKSLEVESTYTIYVDQNIDNLNENAQFSSNKGQVYVSNIHYPFENYSITTGQYYIKIINFPTNAHSQVQHSGSIELCDNVTKTVTVTKDYQYARIILKGWNDEYTFTSSCNLDFVVNGEYNTFGNPRPLDENAQFKTTGTNFTIKYSDPAFSNSISHVGFRSTDGKEHECTIQYSTVSYKIIRIHTGFNTVDLILCCCGGLLLLIFIAYIALIVIGLVKGWLKPSCSNILGFDKNFNSKIFKYGSYETYYYDIELWYSLLARSKVPFLTFNSQDDPIAISSKGSRSRISNAIHASSNTISIFTQTGGHLGWVGKKKGSAGWDDSVALQYFDALVELNKTGELENLINQN
ncbi:hypothetical protein, conserved [Entamoeba histolytica]